ncbi:Transposase IS200 like [Clostridium grantii DSM 8605]|uniref:Transposase IS200 like n=2 Tax=Clostridium TaxID=1485 RepID=A0A1M5VWD7_9CLOT|nr:magnesium chelatase domain-containing protein [Clostridium grantii]SHH79528.1 Transposase IS200 like [Clostridium grantii DSM 8605]
MSNHVHLQVQTTSIHIKEFIRRINGLYAMKFNDKYNYVGHLYQGRYGSEIIETDEYVLGASRYIHLNPVRANMVDKPEDYKWSSYPMIIGELSLNAFLRPCTGVLPMVMEAKSRGINNLVLPKQNIREASLVSGINLFGFETLTEVIQFLEKTKEYTDTNDFKENHIIRTTWTNFPSS